MKYILFLLLLTSVLISSCKKDNPVVPPIPTEPPKAISLSLIDVSCTEAFIKVTVADSVLPVSINFTKDDSTFLSFTLARTDTIVIDTTLQQNTTYTYQTTSVINGEEEKSDTLQVQSLNITSDNFTWQKYYFGNYDINIFYDCAIISEDDIWCVGKFNVLDTVQNIDQTFKAAHWNGSEWEEKSIYYYGECSAVKYPLLYAIFTFPDNKIVVSNGGSIGWVIGDSVQLDCGVNALLTGAIKKIWGISSSDFYVVGELGNIVYYQNGNWIKIESVTDLDVIDIWGDVNPFTNKTEIICGAANVFVNPGSELIRINEDLTTEILDKTGLGQTFGPLWFKSGIRYYVVGDGLYEKTYKDSSIWINLNNNITQYFMECIRGSALNNIIVAGDFGEVIHFNGISWVSIKNTETTLNNGSYYKVAVKRNIVVAVGFDGNQAVILLGHQQ